MNEIPHAEVIIGRCAKEKGYYGMRAQEALPQKWIINWAFPISEDRMKSEKYDENKLDGTFAFTREYPGCPYCGNRGFFVCGSCGNLTCWDGTADVTCAHCGKAAKVGGTVSQVKAGGDA